MRLLTQQDIPAVVQIAQAVMPYAWDEKTFLDCLRPDYHAWVLEKDGKIIGFIVILLQTDECQLMNIAVDINFQHRGFATQLLQHALQFASHHAKHCLLEVRKSNHAAIAFYKKMGAKQIAVRKDYYPAKVGREDALIFSLLCAGSSSNSAS